MNTLTCVQTLLANEEFTQLLGWVLAVAIAIGGIIDESPKNLRNWIFAAVVFAAAEATMRYYYRIHQGGFANAFLCESTAISINVLVTYIIGIVSGWLIVYFGKIHGRKIYEKQVSKIAEEIKETPE